jgi:hypothetical protein
MRLLLPALAATLLLSAVPASAAEPLVAVVPRGDPDVGAAFAEARGAAFAFLDANGNTALDRADPDEPVYIDADGSRAVSHGDLRLTAFGRYPAGTVVELANRDFGRPLTVLIGWLAHDGDTWYFDADAGSKVSVGDLRLAAGGVEKVGPGDAMLNRGLEATPSPRGTLFHLDRDRDNARDALEPILIDQDASGAGYRTVSAGDLRFTPSGFGRDDEVTQQELRDAVAARGTQAPPGTGVPAGSGTGAGTVPVAEAPAPPTWRILDWILVVVGVANLAGLVVVGRMAAARRPKEPFP